MTDDIHRTLVGAGRKIYRRKKKTQGSVWTPENKSADLDDGVWCKACRQRHGYKSKLLQTQYELRSGVWHILWTCIKSGDVVKDQGLVRK